MLQYVCIVTDHRGCQNVERTSVTHSVAPPEPLFCFYFISNKIHEQLLSSDWLR